jgi:CRP/FNR family transcriptional regulator, cyclic AMP receptor protein
VEWRLLTGLPEEDRRRVLGLCRRRRYRPREVIFHEGDPGDTMHLLAKGHVAVRVTTPLGDVATLIVYAPGDFFGELVLVSPNAVRNATVEALDAVETLTLHRDHLDALRHQHPSLDRFLVEALAAEVRRLSARLLEALYVPVDKRVLRRLVELARMYGDDEVAVIPLTQEDLAGLAGTTRPTANKVLRGAEDAGLLRIRRGRLEVLDVDGLERRAR